MVSKNIHILSKLNGILQLSTSSKEAFHIHRNVKANLTKEKRSTICLVVRKKSKFQIEMCCGVVTEKNNPYCHDNYENCEEWGTAAEAQFSQFVALVIVI